MVPSETLTFQYLGYKRLVCDTTPSTTRTICLDEPTTGATEVECLLL